MALVPSSPFSVHLSKEMYEYKIIKAAHKRDPHNLTKREIFIAAQVRIQSVLDHSANFNR